MLKKLFRKKKEDDGDTVSVLSKDQKRKKKIKERIEKFRCYECGNDIYSNQIIAGKLHDDNIVVTPICCEECNNSFIIKEKLGK